MAEVDTSSYPKFQQPNMLDTAAKFQGLAQGANTLQRSEIALSQDKLKQINDQFQIMNAELSTLANNPQITKEQAAQRLTTMSQTFGFKPEVTQHMIGELQTAPDVKTFAQNALVRGMATMEKVNTLYGVPQIYSQGQQDTPVNVSPLRGVNPNGASIQRQIPPPQPTYDAEGNPQFQGPTPATVPEGTEQVPGGIPGQFRPISKRLPVAGSNQPLQPNPIRTQRILPTDRGNLTGPGKTITGVEYEDVPANQVANRFPAPSGPPAGPPVLFEEGKKAYTEDQMVAGKKMMAAKPAIQALPLMLTPGFLSGPLTDQFTKIVAGLKSTGLIDIDENSDPTAIRQEVVKKLHQYVSGSPLAGRSDAAQLLVQSGSPNPDVQILPALVKLTKDAIALDRVQAAMPSAFKGKNYAEYIKHRGVFPQGIDEKAFTLDLEPEEKSKDLVDKMAKQLQSKNNRERSNAEKFFKSLRMAKEQGFYQ